MPVNYKEYPPNWKAIRKRILLRAGNRCEFCGVENHIYRKAEKPNKHGFFQTTFIVLTIAHLDHDKTNHDVRDERLAALCQRCHLKYDLPRHINNRKYGRHYLENQTKLF
jgi:hypothetical protein